MKNILTVIIFIYSCSSVNAQFVEEIPASAKPTHIVGFATSNGRLLDTLYTDTISEVYEGEIWSAVYKTTWLVDFMERSTRSPEKIGLVRTEGPRSYFADLYNFTGPRIGLLYDTSLEENDSTWILSPVKWNDSDPDHRLAVVEDVDYLNCSFGTDVKRLLVTVYENFPDSIVYTLYRHYWYEGIGDDYHPFIPTVCIDGSVDPCEEAPGLYEVFFDGQWYNETSWNCQLATSTGEPTNSSVNTVAIYPNPIPSISLINLSPPENNAVTDLKLFTTTGRLLLNQSDSLFGFTQVNLSSLQLSPGIYYAVTRLRTGRKEVHRLIVQ